MGTRSKSTSLAGALFSRVQSRVLGILFGEPDRQFQITEIITRAGSGRGAVQRELEKLTAAGIVDLTTLGKRKLYHANRASPIFAELRQLIVKTVGVVDPIRDALARRRNSIASAFVFGSLARGTDSARSDIDLMIIGDGLVYSDIYSAMQKAETVLARPINPNLMTVRDWANKVRDRNSFVTRILGQPKLFIFGTEHELEAIGKPRRARIVEGRTA